MGTHLKFLPLGTMGTRLNFLPLGTHMGDETLSALLFLNKHFQKSVHKGSRLEKLDQLNKSKDQKLEETISANPAIIKRGRAEYSSQSNANKRKAESKLESSKPKKRTVELGSSSD